MNNNNNPKLSKSDNLLTFHVTKPISDAWPSIGLLENAHYTTEIVYHGDLQNDIKSDNIDPRLLRVKATAKSKRTSQLWPVINIRQINLPQNDRFIISPTLISPDQIQKVIDNFEIAKASRITLRRALKKILPAAFYTKPARMKEG